MDYRLVFLFFVIAVFLLYRIRSKVSFFGFVNKGNILSLLMVVAILGSVGSFLTMMLDTDPFPVIRRVGYEVGWRQLVNYADAIPADIADQLDVTNVLRRDTDGDGFEEWMVFYQFEGGSGTTPIRAVVYDNDRGNPPTIFPYSLRAPNNEYLSDGDYQFKFEEIVDTQNGPAGNPNLPELVFWGYPKEPFGIPLTANATDLTMFRYQPQESSRWDVPMDNPSRYVPVGRFHGDAIGSIDPSTKEVTVYQRGDYERNLLAFRYVYRLNQEGTSYMKNDNPAALLDPVIATIDFYPDPPSDVYSASIPEQILIAFYASMCSGQGKDLCSHSDMRWEAQKFLAPDGEAQQNFGNDSRYFGLPSFSIANVSITSLSFKSTMHQTSIVGQQGETSTVQITFVVDNEKEQTLTYELQFMDGKWKIVRKLEQQVSTLGSE